MRVNFARKAVLLVSFSYVSTADAQALHYSLLPTGSAAPSARVDGTIAYDPFGKQIFLFGGQDNLLQNDLWVYSLQNSNWTQVPAAGNLPPARFGHTLIFDPVRKRLILFGGQGGGFFSDTWAFDLAGGAWQQLSPNDAGPSRRYGQSAIYDSARDRMVISHGFTDTGRFDDTWAFDLKANSWKNISPANRPLRRCLHHAAYDPAADRMYLYGGCSAPYGPCPLGDLWAFDLKQNVWTELTPAASPPARELYGMAFDSTRGRLQIFGGDGAGLLNDTWDYNPAAAWEMTMLEGDPPSGRYRHETAYAADSGALFFFGGTTAAGATNELWMLAPDVAPGSPRFTAATVVNALSDQGGAVAPGEVVSIFGSGLGPSNGVSFAFDPVTGILPTSGSGVSVTWNGIPAPLLFARADQLNVQVPYELSGASEASVVASAGGTASLAVTVPVAAAAPGLAPVALNGDASLNSPSNPAARGSTITLWATGQGLTVPPTRTGGSTTSQPVLPVNLQMGGLAADVVFLGQASGVAGILQINVNVPSDVTPGDQVPVVLSVGSYQSTSILVAVK